MSGFHGIRLTQTTLRVLALFAADPLRELCGADIRRATMIGPGSHFPILYRLEDAGWLTSRWEEIDPKEDGRPRRRYYRLTPDGTVWVREALAARGISQESWAWNS
jgi:DNA-binding PadR family transcriptional regulator